MKKEIFYFDKDTKEFTIRKELDLKFFGSNIPHTTTLKPLEPKEGFAVCFNTDKWEYTEDNRSKTVYLKVDKTEIKVDYIGAIKDEHTLLKPAQFDKWSVDKWVEDTTLKSEYEKSQTKDAKNKELDNLTVNRNTVFYDANMEAIGNMSAVTAIACFKMLKELAKLSPENQAIYDAVFKQTIQWKGADNKPHTVQGESVAETSEAAMTAKSTILFKY